MSKLSEYLKSLNSAETQWSVYVNPGNPTEEFRIGQDCFENGGMDDGWVCIGSLDRLSYGFQRDSEAFDYAAADCMKVHKYNRNALYEAWTEERLAPQLQAAITEAVEAIQAEWAEIEADHFVDHELPVILEAYKERLAA